MALVPSSVALVPSSVALVTTSFLLLLVRHLLLLAQVNCRRSEQGQCQDFTTWRYLGFAVRRLFRCSLLYAALALVHDALRWVGMDAPVRAQMRRCHPCRVRLILQIDLLETVPPLKAPKLFSFILSAFGTEGQRTKWTPVDGKWPPLDPEATQPCLEACHGFLKECHETGSLPPENHMFLIGAMP